MKLIFNILLLISINLLPFFTFAQNTKDNSITLETILVTANPLKRTTNHIVSPNSIISGKDLTTKLQPTIGETLSRELGVTSTYYGPNTSRPIIRGLDGDQIIILQNEIANLDASATSVDHNIPIDPISIKKIEIIKGPSALLYGSKAIGGVVNIIDNRIPNEQVSKKITGIIDTHYNSVNNERAGSLVLEGDFNDKYTWHINGFSREIDDTKIPGYARSKRLRTQEVLEEGESEEKNKITNSHSSNNGITVGISRFFDKGYIGVSLTNFNNDYGVIGHSHNHEEEHHEEEHNEEEDSHGHDEHESGEEGAIVIDMNQKRVDLAGLYQPTSSRIKEIKYKIGFSDYDHKESENRVIGTIFKNKGYDSRIEFIHNKLGLAEGVIGLQSSESKFSTSGEEAFLPSSITYNNSIFIFEELSINKTNFQIGGRLEYQKINISKNSSFGNLKSRDDLIGSVSLGFIRSFLKNNYSLSFSTSYNKRAPNVQELYSNGEHVSIGVFESGDQDLNAQRSIGLDLSFKKNIGKLKGEVNLFYNYFKNFITLVNTGELNSNIPIYRYIHLPASFYGVEIKATLNAYKKNKQKLDFEIQADYLRAYNRSTSQDLPRISPLRIGGSTIYNYYKTGLRLDVNYVFSQKKVAQSELPTDGYVMVNAQADYKLNIGEIYIKGLNLLDREARNHSSFLKDSVPLPGRSVTIGIKVVF